MYIGDNEWNNHDENFAKTPKKWFISNLFSANHSNYALTFQLHFQNLLLNIHVKCL